MAFQQLTTLARNLQATKMTTSLVQRHLCSGIIPRNSGRTDYETLAVSTPKPYVFHVELNRPKRLNAFNKRMWMDIKECFEELSMNPDCRAIVISAAGKHFTAGIDLADMMGLAGELGDIEDPARKGVLFERLIRLYQESINSLELCPKPVIAAVHSACIGAGVDLSSTADIRYCTKDAYFQIKEVDIGMAADVGTLQRFPKAIGSQSLARELCFTARPFKSDEAKQCGFISEVFADKESMLQGALEIANTIAEKSPIAVQATKANIIYSQSRPNQEGLDHIREINKLNLQSEDLANAVAAQLTKGEKPIYSKL